MRTLLPPSRTILLLLLVACSDRDATRPNRAAAQQPRVSVGQPSGDAIPQDAPTPPGEVLIGGRARACFGEGCTPVDITTIGLPGGAFGYSGTGGIDFLVRSANGVAAANGGPNGSFGLIYLSTVAAFAPISIPFTLQLIFTDPVADPVTITGTLRGSLDPAVGGGAVILTFDDKRIVAGESLKIDFVDPTTGTPGRIELTVPSVLLPAVTGEPTIIGGFFEIR